MDQFPLGPDQQTGSDRTRNVLFVALVLVAAFVTLTIISINRFQRYIETNGDVSYSIDYGSDADTETGDDDVDDTVNTNPLVLPEHIAYGGVESPSANETWLSNEIDAWYKANPEWLCTSLLPYADSNHVATSYGYPTGAALEEDDVQAALFNEFELDEEFWKNAVRFELGKIEPSDMITGVCKGANAGYFITTLVGDGRFAVVYGVRANTLANGFFSLDEYQPVGGIMDGYRFVPDLGNGKAYIMTGYGDAGFIDWQYYELNPELRTSELVESCSGGAPYDEATAEAGDYVFTCDLEYSPS